MASITFFQAHSSFDQTTLDLEDKVSFYFSLNAGGKRQQWRELLLQSSTRMMTRQQKEKETKEGIIRSLNQCTHPYTENEVAVEKDHFNKVPDVPEEKEE